MANPPNVLLITTDELHREALSYYGATSHSTPNIDQFAAESTIYDSAYTASPICLPSRCALATGLYPHNNHSISNRTGGALNQRLPNIFSIFKNGDYRTSMHGKCHFIPVPYRQVQADFTQEYEHFRSYYTGLGIDHLDLQDGNAVSAWFYDDYAKALEQAGLMREYRDLLHNKGRSRDRKNLFLFPGPASMQPDAWVGGKAVEHIESLPSDQSHFMWVSFSGPHYPQNPPAEYLERLDIDKDQPRRFRADEWLDESKSNYRSFHGPSGTEGSGSALDGAQKNFDDDYWREWRQMYYANVVQIDDMVGNLISAARAKWGEDLVIIFTADHGDMMGHHGIWGKNGAFYEDVLRVPLFIQYPGQRVPEIRPEHVSLIDLLPTLIQACELNNIQYDGQPLQDLAQTGGRRIVVSEAEGLISVIEGTHKLTWHRRLDNGETYYELYDLAQDPFEFVNIYGQNEYAQIQRNLEYWIQTLDGGIATKILFFEPGSGNVPPWFMP